MKEMIKHIKILSLVLFMMSWIIPVSIAQEEEASDEPLYVDFMLHYLKQTDDSYKLTATLLAETEEGYVPAIGLPVEFSFLTDTVNYILGTVETDGEGKAKFVIPAGTLIHKDEDGYMNFNAEFSGDDVYDANYGEFMAKDAIVTMDLEIVDSVKTVMLTVSYIDGEGMEVPLNEDDIFLFVQGMLSKLQIADCWLEEGECMIELEDDIPGDSEGNITLIAGYIEHGDFGDVEKRQTINWGAIPDYSFEESGKLWTNVAPTWMIVLLVILLAGVWGHYIYAMYQLGRINKLDKQARKE